jgi:hypothetical protein
MKRIKQELTEETEGKSLLPLLPPVRVLFTFYFTFCLLSTTASAQIQQAWVTRYNNGITNGNHQALKMSLDSSGNIYVIGFSQNNNAQTGYATLKYAPNGTQLWATRYDSTNGTAATPAALVVDLNNDVVVTGSALTIKYDSTGIRNWAAPCAGHALAVDADKNIYVTGFGTNFNTQKLSVLGSNVWATSFSDIGPTLAQTISIDKYTNIYIAGSDVYFYFNGGHYEQLITIKCSPNGQQLWTNMSQHGPAGQVTVAGSGVDASNDLCVVANYIGGAALGYDTFEYTSGGSLKWNASPNFNFNSRAYGLAINRNSDLLMTGKAGNDFPNYFYGSFKLSAGGSTLWTNFYPQPSSGVSAGNSIAIDSANNSYVTGCAPGADGSNDIVTIAYDTNGKQLWLQRYDGPAHGDDAGNAIAVDNNGNVYVAGYETVIGGGTEMVLIKYSPVTIQRQINGNILLQAQGAPGEPFDIRASTNLDTWSDVATNNADTNGLLQFLDTNAGLYPARFYLTIPQ